MAATKPIRVFYSDLYGDGHFYATQNYKETISEDGKRVTTLITGKKYDVTQDIARAIAENDIQFTPATTEQDN